MEGEPHTLGKGLASIFTVHYQGLLLLVPPIIFSPIYILSDDKKPDGCMYILLVMIIYWISEVVPLGITSMLPLIAFPMMDIMSTNLAAMTYFKDVLAMFLTSIMVATAIEYSNLHVRLALKVLQTFGCSPMRLHFGICLATMFMSIWIANSAATAMMLPIIRAVLEELYAQGLIEIYHEEDLGLPIRDRRPSKISMAFYLSVCFSSSIGGLGSLIGTPTNLVFKGIYEGRFPEATDNIHFGTFMAYSWPFVFLGTLALYITLEVVFMGLFRPNSKDAKGATISQEGVLIGKGVIDSRYEDLGNISTHEISVGVLFVILICLYVLRSPGFIKGWAIDVFDNKEIRNSAPTVLILILLFILPTNYKFLKFWHEDSLQKTEVLLDWDFVGPKVPWSLIFLVGGGGVLAEGSKKSGMASKLGDALSVIEVFPPTIVLLICITAAVLMTNFSANVAICNITLPVLCELAVVLKVHPLSMVLPVGMGCSVALILPVGTPPNAMVQGYANVPTNMMIYAGSVASFVIIIIFWILGQTWGLLIYPSFDKYPDWAEKETNSSDSRSYDF